MLVEGIFAPITTPFHPDGRLFRSKLRQNVEHYSRAPLSGMLVLDDAGEAGGLTDAEAEMVLADAIATAANEKVMLASVGRGSVFATLRLAGLAAELGYDAVVVRPSRLLDPGSMTHEAMTFFHAVADRSPLPVVVASDPVDPLTVASVAELAGHPNVLGLIDVAATPDRISALRAATSAISREVTVSAVFAPVTGRMLRASANAGDFVPASSLGRGATVAIESRPSLRTRTRRVGFQILTGQASKMLSAWQAGASGSVARFATCAPQATCEVWQAFRDGDLPLAEEKQERLRQASSLVEGFTGIAVLKYACDWNGYFGGQPRLPLLPPTAATRSQLEEALAGMRN